MQLSTTIAKFSRMGFGRAALGAMLLLTLIVAGCGNGGGSDSASGAASGAASPLSHGVAHGANGPIVGATVIAYKAGTSGFGTGAVAIASAVTDKTGAFNFTSGTCNTGDAIYYVSRGGNAGGGVNPAIALMSEVGLCESLPNVVMMNEVTTVASVYAVAQFIGHSSPYRVGTSATNATGLKNAFTNAGNLVDVTTGKARSAPIHGGIAPQRNVNTIANALISCVNSGAGSAMCAELFDCAKPGAIFDGGASCSGGTGTTPTDTLGATLNIALNPAQVSVAGIFDSSTIRPIFQPALTSVPGSLTLIVNFVIPGAFITAADGMAIDAAGNVWIPNGRWWDPYGGVLKMLPSGALGGSFDNSTRGANFAGPFQIAIDNSGNAWVANWAGSSATKLTSSGALIGNFNNSDTPGANFNGTASVAVDGSNNAWLTNSRNHSVTKLSSNGALAGNFDDANTPGANFAYPWGVAIDAGGNAWVANSGNGTVTKLSSSGALLANFNNANTPGANFYQCLWTFIGTADSAWIQNLESVTKISSGGSALNFNNANTPGADFTLLAGPAIDSAGHVWVPNNASNNLTELDSNGKLVGNTPLGVPVGTLKIDAAGDLWEATAGDTLSEIIGLARPVRTPLAACRKLSPPSAVCLP